MKKAFLLVLLLIFKLSVAQETVGLVYNDSNEIKSNGYTLLNPRFDNRVFLINNCGEVVHQWTASSPDAINAYLLENGNLLIGSGLNAEIRDWDDNIIWSLNYQDVLGFRVHHDIEPLPNGNYLVLVRDEYTRDEMIAKGMSTSFTEDVLRLERIVEIEPLGTDSANIVWEWKLVDHIIQDFDNTKPNYGIVSAHPELLDVNYDGGEGSNPIHANAIDYNEELDQIAISARHLSEVFIIDHSTTTAQAATQSGGLYGQGGDFLWRWGNPEVYDQGTEADKKLGKQHDIKWIVDGPNQGKLSVFSNIGYGSDIEASSIHIIDQNDTNGVYNLNNGKFSPTDYFWSWDGIILDEVMHGSARCGLQIMSNGNALINESDIGRITEVDMQGNIIWVYMIPVRDNNNLNQFSTTPGNGSFRAHRYSEDYIGFNGVSFNNTGIIEDQNSVSENCQSSLGLVDSEPSDFQAYPNPTQDFVYFNRATDSAIVFDITGKIIINQRNSGSINLANFEDGIYLIKISVDDTIGFVKVLKH